MFSEEILCVQLIVVLLIGNATGDSLLKRESSNIFDDISVADCSFECKYDGQCTQKEQCSCSDRYFGLPCEVRMYKIVFASLVI